MLEWSTACPDWEKRIVEGTSIVPVGALYPQEAEEALRVFKSLRIVDAPGRPTFGEAGDQWVFDFVRAIFGAYDPATGIREINEFFLCISKKNGKSLIAAGIMLTALIRNWRHSGECTILAPTIKAAGNAFKPAADMVRADPNLNAAENGFLHIQDHLRTITHMTTSATLRILAADTGTVAGNKSGFVLYDELWELASKPDADAMMREAAGGLVARPEGFTISITTMADAPAKGVFKDKLEYARGVRDGTIVDPKFLPVIYEFPASMITGEDYQKPENFYITNPFLGRTATGVKWIKDELAKEIQKGPGTRNVFLAKHLNIEIGSGLRTDAWAGAVFWPKRADSGMRAGLKKARDGDGLDGLREMLARCDVATVGIDGGGLDDLLGLCVLGREKDTRRWLAWCRAWCHEILKERHKQIVSKLDDLVKEGTLTIIPNESEDDIEDVVDVLEVVRDAGLMPEDSAIGIDRIGIPEIIDGLSRRQFTFPTEDEDMGQVRTVAQGFRLNAAIGTTGRRLAKGNLLHEGSVLMDWCVTNAKSEQKGNGVMITKEGASAKIDPLMALLNAAELMTLNPTADRSVYEEQDLRVV